MCLLQGGKEKKKRKEPEVEMTHSAPLLSVLAQFHVPTDCFIDGQFIYSTVLQHDDAMLSNRSRSPESNTSNRKVQINYFLCARSAARNYSNPQINVLKNT